MGILKSGSHLVYLTTHVRDDQHEALKALREARRIPMSVLVRDAIDLYLKQQETKETT